MRDLENIQKSVIEKKTPQQEETLDWKSSLSQGLCKSQSQLNIERTWAKFISRMRDLCPETTWLSIGENTEKFDQKTIVAIQFWLESLVTKPDWPFPKQVIIMSPAKDHTSFRIIFPITIEKLPFAPFPKGLSVTTWKDKYSCGWKILSTETFNSTKTGEA